MDKDSTKQTRKIKIFLLICATAVFCTVAAVGLIFAWIARNDNVRGSISAGIFSGYNISVSVSVDGAAWDDGAGGENDKLLFSDFFCGSDNARSLGIKVKNPDDKSFLISTGFCAVEEAGKETPAYDGAGQYFHLGSQIKALSYTATCGAEEQTGIIDKFLVQTFPLNNGQVNGVGQKITGVPRLELVKNYLLKPHDTAVFYILFEFVDNGSDQSMYSAFSGECVRELYLAAE